jgi:hypothetical protein
VQTHVSKAVAALGHEGEAKVRMAACALVRALLVRGAVHHQQCIVPLVRAVGDAAVHELALAALTELHDRNRALPALLAKGIFEARGDPELFKVRGRAGPRGRGDREAVPG